MITAVEGNHFFLELVILIFLVESICRVFVERVVAWSRDATIWGMGCVGGFHKILFYSLSVIRPGSISNFEKANNFLPRSFNEAPIW